MLDFIVNPSAGGKDGKKIKRALPKIEKHLAANNIPYVVHMTKNPKQATMLTDFLIKNGATDIIVVGGDGTLHEVLNGFSNFENVNLGIIPCGTGNDFISALKLPLDPIKALNIILNGEAKYTDFMQMPTVRGFNIIGMGIDVDVLKRYSRLKKKTKFKYTLCLIKALCHFKCISFDAEIDGKKSTYNSFMACIANGYRYGGGIPICPVADPTDKQLDFVAIKNMSKLKLIKAFVSLKKGNVLKAPETTHINMQKVKIFPNGHYTVNVDGELYDDIPFEVEIVSDTLKIYRP